MAPLMCRTLALGVLFPPRHRPYEPHFHPRFSPPPPHVSPEVRRPAEGSEGLREKRREFIGIPATRPGASRSAQKPGASERLSAAGKIGFSQPSRGAHSGKIQLLLHPRKRKAASPAFLPPDEIHRELSAILLMMLWMFDCCWYKCRILCVGILRTSGAFSPTILGGFRPRAAACRTEVEIGGGKDVK